MLAQTVSDATVQQWWLAALGLTVVAAIVVAAMLELIVRSTERIHRAVAAVWSSGARIAANTVTIALIRRTNDLAGALLESAGRIAQAAARIRQAAGG